MNFISPKNVALLVAAGLIASTGTAIAAETATPAPTTKTHSPSPEIVAFKAALTQYRAGHEAAINTFKSAIASGVVAAFTAASLVDFAEAIADLKVLIAAS